MRLDDIQDEKGPYPAVITLSLSVEAKRKLMELKAKGKSHTDFIRKAIDQALEKLAI